MSEILTTKQFKATHQLSDSAFQRLVKKICDEASLTRDELICPISSREHQIIKPELFEAAIANRKPRVKAIETVEAEIVDPVAIQAYTPRVSALDTAFSSLQPIEVNPTYVINDRSDSINSQMVSIVGFLNNQAQNSDALIQAELEQARQEGMQLAVAKFQAKKQAETEAMQRLQEWDAMNSGLVKKSPEEQLSNAS